MTKQNSVLKTSNFKKYTSRNPLQSYLIKRFLSHVYELIYSLPATDLLDAGCGEGFALDFFLKSGLKPKRVVGLDLNRDALKIAKKKVPYAVFRRGDIAKIPFKNKSFDLVTCLETIEHISDYRKAIDELIRVSRGFILVSVPWEPYFSIANLLRLKNIKLFGKDPEHVNFWSKKSFARLLDDFQVEVIAHQIIFPLQAVLFKVK